MTDYCPTCHQALPTPCAVCGDPIRAKDDYFYHQADHRPVGKPGGKCETCTLPLKTRVNRLSHIWDHVAEIGG
jgi:hypothetical protein